MRALFLLFCSLSLIAVLGLAMSSPATVQADTRLTIEPGVVDAAIAVNCRWLCTEGHGGPGEANVTGATACAAACEAGCGGAEFCRVSMYIASAGTGTPIGD